MSQSEKILFHDYSNKLFTKIKLSNPLTKIEIRKLNDKYREFRLNIKQVIVDKNGDEIPEKESIEYDPKTNRPKRHIKKPLTIKELYYKYHTPKKNFKKNPKNQRRKFAEKSKDIPCSKKELQEISSDISLILRKNEQIDFKNCKLDTQEFRLKIINYINNFKKFLPKEIYEIQFLKFKNKAMEFKGMDLSNPETVNDLINWPSNILKSFKSLIYVLAVKFNLDVMIKGNENNMDLNQIINDNLNSYENGNLNDYNNDNNSESDSKDDEDDDSSNGEQIRRIELEKQANNDGNNEGWGDYN